MNAAQWVLIVVVSLLALPAAVLLIECLAALLPPRPRPRKVESADPSPSFVVLIPAHNEQQGIAATVQPLRGQLGERSRVLVVADNCDDQTAAVARDAGAEVIERHDEQRRGKGYALAFGVAHLAEQPPEVVIVLDADCSVSPGSLDQLARTAAATGRPVQAAYRMEPPPSPTPRDLISMLAFTVKNLVRPRGLAALGQPCPLQGTGMALPWPLAARMNLATGHLVEDMQMGVEAALLGRPPMWMANAAVTSRLPQQAAAATSQRTRWEQGHLQTIITAAPRLIAHGIVTLRPSLIVQGIDHCVPPLALLVLLLMLATAGSAIAGLLGAGWIATIISLGALSAVALAVLIGWWVEARKQVPARSLLAVPAYVLWKVPIYVGFLLRRQKAWVRTEREDLATGQQGPPPH